MFHVCRGLVHWLCASTTPIRSALNTQDLPGERLSLLGYFSFFFTAVHASGSLLSLPAILRERGGGGFDPLPSGSLTFPLSSYPLSTHPFSAPLPLPLL